MTLAGIPSRSATSARPPTAPGSLPRERPTLPGAGRTLPVDHRQVVRILATLRVVVGALLLVAPGAAGRRWLGDVARQPTAKAATRGLGARDLAFGLGPLRALDRGEPARAWVQLAAVGDSVDAVSGVLAARHLGPVRAIGTVASAAGAAALGFTAGGRVDEGNPVRPR